MLTQIFENRPLRLKEYVRLRFSGRTTRYDGVFIRLEDGHFLFSNDPCQNGSKPWNDYAFASLGFNYSWKVCVSDSTTPREALECRLLNVELDVDERKREKFYCDFISNHYDSNRQYCGYHGYHSHSYSCLNKPKKESKYLFGVEMEVEFDNDEDKDNFTSLTSNWFYCERDGSLGENGCEIISIPLLPSDAKSVDFWKPLTGYLQNCASATSNCGLHVHVSRSILGCDEVFNLNLGKLLYAYHHHWADTSYNIKIAGRRYAYHALDGKTSEGEAATLLGSKVFRNKTVVDKVSNSMRTKSQCDRYHDINITNSNTIEFRKGAGTIDPMRVSMLVEYFELLCKYAVQAVWQNICEHDIRSFLLKRAKNQLLIQILQQ